MSWCGLGFSGEMFRNLNTPEELEKAKKCVLGWGVEGFCCRALLGRTGEGARPHVIQLIHHLVNMIGNNT